MATTRYFPNGCVAAPHHLAAAAGQTVLASGGNAVDAALAANLVLAVVTPYHCGVGGDLLALVWDGTAHGLISAGAAPGGATPAAIRAAVAEGHGDASVSFPGTDGMPMLGALSVTVPGAAAGWHHLLERWGSRSFGDVGAAAVRLAVEGFVVSPQGAGHVERARARLASQPHWSDTFGRMRTGERFLQPDLARTLDRLAVDGPGALHGGAVGSAIVETLQANGSSMTLADLKAHRPVEVVPLRGRYRDVEVLELPPPTHGVTALTALGILDHLGPLPDDPVLATHLQIEAIKAALADRQEHLADPSTMRTSARSLLAPERIARLAEVVDASRAGAWTTGRPAPGGTAYVCAADGDGLLVSLVQSNFVGFGSGVVVPGTGVGLHNRGAHFSLDPADPNVIAPGKRPMHTLIPALALREGAPWLVFGTMGGDGQPQTHVQLLGSRVDRDVDLQDAIDAPRWLVDPATGDVAIESRATDEVVRGLEQRGHRVSALAAFDYLAGHAHAIEVLPGGYAGATDPRCEGAIVGT